MNKKGITLIELIASITILAILSLIAVPIFSTVKQKTLEKAYDSKVSSIKNAALDYAEENINFIPKNGNFYIKVGYLIVNGYLSGDDDNETINNPKTGKSMNNELVCIKFNNVEIMTRKLVACICGVDCAEDECNNDET